MSAEFRIGNRFVRIWSLLPLTAVLCLLFFGCGGGSGGDAGGGTPTLTYSGVSTPAEITSDNADALAAGAFDAGASGSGFTQIAALDEVESYEEATGRPFLTGISNVMQGAAGQIDFRAAAEQSVSSAVQTESRTIHGTCGGSATYSIQVDTVSGAFSGSLTFSGYCEDGLSMSGHTSFYGFVNPGTEELESFTFSFDYISGTSGSASIAMAGQVDLSVSGATLTVTMNMMVQDNNANRVCKVEAYQMIVTDHGTYAEVNISGRFYDPDYGYIDLQTTSNFMINTSDEYPYSGQMILTGETGTAGGPTSAMLTAHDLTTCQVRADTNGDGDYDDVDDYDSGAIPWTDL